MGLEFLVVELYLLGAALAVLVLDLLLPGREGMRPHRSEILGWCTSGLLGIGLLLSFLTWHPTVTVFGGVYVRDTVAVMLQRLFLATGLLVVLFSIDFTTRCSRNLPNQCSAGEYYLMLLFSLLGMCVLSAARELTLLFVALELATLPLFVLTCFYFNARQSAEAAVKYAVIGVVSAGLFVYGLSWLYGAYGGSTILGSEVVWPRMIPIAVAFLLVGIGFKATVVPFHLWAPDVYQGAPTPITAFLAIASKTAGLVILYRVSVALWPVVAVWFAPLLAVLAAFTMTWGNVVACRQTQIKRLLAYSSIAQAGYLLMGFLANDAMAASAFVFYLVVYLVTTVAAFGVVIYVEHNFGVLQIEGYRGLALKRPGIALVLMLALFSLAGVPPLAGFFGKFWLFAVAASQGWYWLVLLAAVNSTVSLFYYLQVIKEMYLREPEDSTRWEGKARVGWSLGSGLAIATAGMLLVVVAPGILERIYSMVVG